MNLISKVPTYVLMMKIDYEKVYIVVDKEGVNTLDRSHYDYGVNHYYHNSPWLGKKRRALTKELVQTLIKL